MEGFEANWRFRIIRSSDIQDGHCDGHLEISNHTCSRMVSWIELNVGRS